MIKKKTITIISLVLAFLVFNISIIGCAKIQRDDWTDKYLFGIVETTEQRNSTTFTLYDVDINIAGQVSFPYGSMGDQFSSPQVVGDKLYTVPNGLGQDSELTILFEMDMKTGKSRTIDFGLWGSSCFYATKNYAFVSRSVNGKSDLTRIGIKDEKIKTIKLKDDDYIGTMVDAGNNLYVFVNDSSGTKPISSLLVYDIKTLEQIHRYDITNFGATHLDAVYANDAIYFTSFTKPGTYQFEDVDNRLIKFNIETGGFKDFILEKNNPSKIIYSSGKLFVLNSDLVSVVSTGITIFDIEKEIYTFFPLDDSTITDIHISGKNLYALGNTKVHKYEIKSDEITLLTEENIRTKTGNNPYYYLGGMYIK